MDLTDMVQAGSIRCIHNVAVRFAEFPQACDGRNPAVAAVGVLKRPSPDSMARSKVITRPTRV
jgi:hypothetical protein